MTLLVLRRVVRLAGAERELGRSRHCHHAFKAKVARQRSWRRRQRLWAMAIIVLLHCSSKPHDHLAARHCRRAQLHKRGVLAKFVPWAPNSANGDRSKEEHGGCVGSDFMYPHGIMWLTCRVALGLKQR